MALFATVRAWNCSAWNCGHTPEGDPLWLMILQTDPFEYRAFLLFSKKREDNGMIDPQNNRRVSRYMERPAR